MAPAWLGQVKLPQLCSARGARGHWASLHRTPSPTSSSPPGLAYTPGDKADPDRLFPAVPIPTPHPHLRSTPPAAGATVGTGQWQGWAAARLGSGKAVPGTEQGRHSPQRQQSHPRDARGARGSPSTPTGGHPRGSGAGTRTENAERNSGPFPFVRVRREQKGDASDPHAAEPQARLTPTTRPLQQPKRASRCRPGVWHPRRARGPRPDGPERRHLHLGSAPRPGLRHAASPRWSFTIGREPPLASAGLQRQFCPPCPALPRLAATNPPSSPKNCRRCNFQLERSRNRKEGTARRRTPGGCLPGAN